MTRPQPFLKKLVSSDEAASRRLWLAESPGLLRSLASFSAHSGDSWFWGPALLLVWLLGTPEWKRCAAWMLVGMALTALLVFAIKFTVRRRRPEGEWGGIYRRADPHSFPSGHAARAMMLAICALALAPAWLGWALLIWAPLVMLARVALGVHYLSDVVAGALLGCGIGLLILWAIPRVSIPF